MMKKLILNITLFVILIFTISIFCNKVVYPRLNIAPWSWGSSLIYQKELVLKSAPEKYNTLFIGSSRVYRHINPAVIDSMVNPALNMHSFNMGVNWLFTPESFYVYDNLIKDENLKLKYVIIELSKIPNMDYQNLHTSRIKYWYNFSQFNFVLNGVMASNTSLLEKIGTITVHTISYIDNLINLGYFTEVFSFKTESEETDNQELGPAGDGFLPFNTTTGIHADPNFRGRHQKLLADTSKLNQLLDVSLKTAEQYENNRSLLNQYNSVYVSKINSMIADAKKRGIHVVFLFTPKLPKSQYVELIPVFEQIDPAHRIAFADGRKYAELYQVQYAFDLTHFNEAGANYYSSLVATALDSLLMEKP